MSRLDPVARIRISVLYGRFDRLHSLGALGAVSGCAPYVSYRPPKKEPGFQYRGFALRDEVLGVPVCGPPQSDLDSRISDDGETRAVSAHGTLPVEQAGVRDPLSRRRLKRACRR